MEKILKAANELGLMINNTELYEKYKSYSDKIENDPASKKLYEEYLSSAQELYQRQQSGDIIEQFENENLKTLSELVVNNELILGYINAQKEYADLLVQIQDAIMNKE